MTKAQLAGLPANKHLDMLQHQVQGRQRRCDRFYHALREVQQTRSHRESQDISRAMGIAATKSKQTPSVEGLFASFTRSQKALEYVKERGLEQVAEIDYNPGSQSSQMKYCLIFPLKDDQNKIASFYGRSILNDSDKRHYYSANRKELYPGYLSANTTKLILTEAVIDAATLLQLPEINQNIGLLCLYGTNVLTDEHLAAIKESSQLNEIILFLDGDEVGRKAVEKHFETLHSLLPKLAISYVETPEDEDVNSLYMNYDKEAILQLLDERVFLFSTEKPIEKEKPELPGQPVTIQSKLNARNPEYIAFETRGLLFVLLGGLNLHQLDRMRVTAKVSRSPELNGSRSIRHTVDLYNYDLTEKSGLYPSVKA